MSKIDLTCPAEIFSTALTVQMMKAMNHKMGVMSGVFFCFFSIFPPF